MHRCCSARVSWMHHWTKIFTLVWMNI